MITSASRPENSAAEWRNCVLGLLVLIWSVEARGLDDVVVDDSQVDEVSSIFTAYTANLQSLESYDLSIQTDSTWVSDQAPIVEELTHVRLMFDRERKRYLTAERSTTQGWVRPREDVESQRFDLLTAAVSVENVTILRLRPDIRFPTSTMEEGFANMQHTPDIQNVGLFRFPAKFRPQSEEKRSAERRRLMAHINKIEIDESHFSVEFQDTASRARIINFDRLNMVPSSALELYLRKDGQRVMMWKESYHFANHQGIQLPTKIVLEKNESKEIDSKKVFGTLTRITDFEWTKVNEQLEDKYFVQAILEDDNFLLQLTSPKARP